MEFKLSKTSFGRAVLHLACLIHDGRWHWHWAGIYREFATSANRLHRKPAELVSCRR
jgi:hypothetical protein